MLLRDANDCDAEACCVCLDPLNSAPVSILLSCAEGNFARTCTHFLHTECAEYLRPTKCPLCRQSFHALSEPVSRKSLLELDAEEFVRMLRRLDADESPRSRSSTAKATSVIKLLAATLPISEPSLWELFGSIDANSDVSAPELRQVLDLCGISEVEADTLNAESTMSSTVTFATCNQPTRRLRRIALRVVRGLGSGISMSVLGVLIGAIIGGIWMVSPRFRTLRSPAGMFGVIFYIFCFLESIADYVSVDGTLLGVGSSAGVCLGFFVDFVCGCAVVDVPSGFCNAFCRGVQCDVVLAILSRCMPGCFRGQNENERLVTNVPIFQIRSGDAGTSASSTIGPGRGRSAFGDGGTDAAGSGLVTAGSDDVNVDGVGNNGAAEAASP
eukprot:TRINITY_DN36820_c0_g1_i2.p1 TRINITY_DN36820_c0_g1~~TRINITY_DN36820_c0_g1_i2.p1  ORF type:complete len:385 (+),score=43.50 TRINITY_DN36820_c0_g1_i2:46-1200(+)